MKTLQELEAIRQKTINELNLRKNREDGIRVVVAWPPAASRRGPGR